MSDEIQPVLRGRVIIQGRTGSFAGVTIRLAVGLACVLILLDDSIPVTNFVVPDRVQTLRGYYLRKANPFDHEFMKRFRIHLPSLFIFIG